MKTSARNDFLATVESVKTDGVIGEVKGKLDDGTGVCALIKVTSVLLSVD